MSSDAMDPIEYVIRSKSSDAKPLISVVIPTRNHAPMLAQAVDAILAQDVEDLIELIVCDNGSTDETPEVMNRAVEWATHALTYVRLRGAGTPARSRNLGIELAAGRFVAFTDSDCVPARSWLREALKRFDRSDVGMVQGRTEPARPSVPFFSHFIVTRHLDGSFSTSNIVYRREALAGHRFDPTASYWEDADLGWRVAADGWKSVFAPDAQVDHQVIAMEPLKWILWPTRFTYWPAKVRRYPESRRNLFLGMWVRPLHLFFDLAVIGVSLSPWRLATLLLALPYAFTFGTVRGIRGSLPPAKVAAYVAQDSVALATLIYSSINERRLVL